MSKMAWLRWILTSGLLLFSIVVQADDGITWEARGNFDAFFSYYDLNSRTRSDPNNEFNIPETIQTDQLDFTVSGEESGFKVLLEGYGRYDSNGQSRSLMPYQLYVADSFDNGRWYFRVGKFLPNWGVGQLWNPVRGITSEGQKDLVFPNDNIDGLRLAEVQYVLSLQTSMSLYALPPQNGNPSGVALRLSSSIDDFDYALSAYRNNRDGNKAGLEWSYVVGPATLLGEFAYSNQSNAIVVMPDGSWQERGFGTTKSYVLGGNTMLPGDYLLLLEYYHDDDAYNKSEYNAFANQLPSDIDLLNPLGNGKDTVYAGITKHLLQSSSSISFGAFHNYQSAVSLYQIRFETQILKQVGLLVMYGRYDQQSHLPTVNIYRTTLDVRLRWNF